MSCKRRSCIASVSLLFALGLIIMGYLCSAVTDSAFIVPVEIQERDLTPSVVTSHFAGSDCGSINNNVIVDYTCEVTWKISLRLFFCFFILCMNDFLLFSSHSDTLWRLFVEASLAISWSASTFDTVFVHFHLIFTPEP